MYSGLVDHFGAIAGRMAYVFAVALLVSASVAHSQVIEEGGFPVKGGGVSGEPFSLSVHLVFMLQQGNPFCFRVLRQRYRRRAFATLGRRSRATGSVF